MIVLQIPLEAIPDAFDFDDPMEPDPHSSRSNASRKGPVPRFAENFDRSRLLPSLLAFNASISRENFTRTQTRS